MKPKAVTTRRRFFWKAGAALSAPLAVAAADAPGHDGDSEALKARLRLLEDGNAIRELNRSYARHVNARAHDEVARLFADPADAAVDERIRSISADRLEQRDVIEFSTDHDTATARVHCTVQIEAPIEPTCPLVEMAREQGGGISRRSESGVFDNLYVKQGGVWKIARSTYVSAETLDTV